jgi:hypothetical protein
VFETEQEVGLTAGKLTQIVSLWPGRDSYIDHSTDFAAGLPIQLFSLPRLLPIPHHLYLSHEKLLALAGLVTLSLEVQLQQPGGQPLDIQWEYWDGEVWRGFLSLAPQCLGTDNQVPDSTAGLSQSGRIELTAEGATSQQTVVNGAVGYWIRGRIADPLPAASTQILPEIDNLRLSSIVTQPFRPSLTVLQPEKGGLAPNNGDRHESPRGFVFLKNASGTPIIGATVTARLKGANQDIPLTEFKLGPLGHYRLSLQQLQIAESLRVLFFGVDVEAPAGIDDAHQPTEDKNVLPVTLKLSALAPDAALADSTKLDTTKPFYPFGQQPQPGSTFYFSSHETFSKPNAKMRVYLPLTSAPVDDIAVAHRPAVAVGAGQARPPGPDTTRRTSDPQVEWEYWNGRAWAPLTPSSTNQGLLNFSQSEIADFTIPADMEVTTVAGQTRLWVRARLMRGGFGYTQEITWQAGPTDAFITTMSHVVTHAPVLADIQIAYTWQYGPFPFDRVISYNDFQYRDRTAEALWPGNTFKPFECTVDVTPELYLGFDKAPPAADLGIFFNVAEQRGDIKGSELTWEYWNGFTWTTVLSADDTGNLRVPGIVGLISEDDSAPLARFDVPFHWLRGRLKEDGPPGSPVVNGIYPNAVWAAQQSTLADVAIGLSDASPNQSFAIHQIPVLEGERIEVRELAGPRANVEWRIAARAMFDGDETKIKDLEDQLGQEGLNPFAIQGGLRLRRDRLKQVSEVWVLWSPLATIAGAGSNDRVYTIDRARGILSFGDGRNGRIPPNGASILGRVLRTGGGAAGNVAPDSIKQLLGVVVGVQSVTNPVAAEGGSDAEAIANFADRGPRTVRHRGRAISISDYETLAQEASSAVAFARAIPVQDPGARNLPGWVTLLILPNSLDSRPWPSFGLREEVREFLETRAPADLAGGRRIFVTGPDYLAIDVSATLAPRLWPEAGDVDTAARAALAAFLHPLYGGPLGAGWDLGRSVYLSDVSAVLASVDGLDYVSDLKLLIDGQVQGASVTVGPSQIVVAGQIRITLQAP